ncbi:hypothetical protein JB92DRAFT_1910282 [Gautieria morchelliformis]|nr:hypothetical protein JB92DRAFT_1910282 [Gautieria morchelliformis]
MSLPGIWTFILAGIIVESALSQGYPTKIPIPTACSVRPGDVCRSVSVAPCTNLFSGEVCKYLGACLVLLLSLFWNKESGLQNHRSCMDQGYL